MLFNELNNEQQIIINTLKTSKSDFSNANKNFLINSAAGSGKTYTATKIIKNVLSSGEKALYLVFNRQMKKQFDYSLKKNDLLHKVDAKTFHGLLRQNNYLDYSIKKQLGVSVNELSFNYQKGDYNKTDIAKIAKNLANQMYDLGLIAFLENEERTKKYMIAYSQSIEKELSKFINLYLKTKVVNAPLFLKELPVNFKIFFPYQSEERITKYFNSSLFKRRHNDEIFTDVKSFVSYLIIQSFHECIKKKELDITHSFYYKKIYETAMRDEQFLKFIFKDYSCIILDEAQDTDENMYNLISKYSFLCQKEKEKKIFVFFGDKKQSIYSFNGTFNIFECEDINKMTQLSLSKSFRFGKNIANFSKLLVNDYHSKDEIIGNIYEDKIYTRAINAQNIIEQLIKNIKNQTKYNTALICRTNNSCFEIFQTLQNELDKIKIDDKDKEKLIVLDTEIKKKFKEANKHKLTELIENKQIIEDLKIKLMHFGSNINIEQISLEEALKNELIVSFIKHRKELNYILKLNTITLQKILNSKNRKNAHLLITNVHQSKGLEFNNVILANDFFCKNKELYVDKEEANIAHVAVTRARENVLFYEDKQTKNILQEIYISNQTPMQLYKQKQEIKEQTKAVIDNECYVIKIKM